jgi:error-prone DNA polymerase
LSHSTLAHPLEPYRERLSARGLPDALSVARAETGKPVSYAGLVICRQRPENAGGALFLTLEDETGFVNCVVWDRTFQRYRALILTSSVLGVTGKLEKEGRVVHIIVQRCWDPFSRPERLPARSRDFH